MDYDLLIWLGIVFCVSQSAMFSGLNLAFFSLSRLQLEIAAAEENRDALAVMQLRADANLLLSTILWGNVSVNVWLTLLSHSVMTGVTAFLFSTVLITFLGEIVPQAYCARYALPAAALLAPVLRLYRWILYPVAKPTAMMLDWWLGKEGVRYWRERELRSLIRRHMEAEQTDIAMLEGTGALNFLAIDDVPVAEEGEPVNPDSIISLPERNGLLAFPDIARSAEDPFIRRIEQSGHRWVILTDKQGRPRLLVDSDRFVREALFRQGPFEPYRSCHRPVVVTDPRTPLGHVIRNLKGSHPANVDVPIERDVVLVWSPQVKRVITGADILGRLFKGIGSTTGT